MLFQSSYKGGNYVTEERAVEGQRVPCVPLDSVAFQGNRMELALLETELDKTIFTRLNSRRRAGHCPIPG